MESLMEQQTEQQNMEAAEPAKQSFWQRLKQHFGKKPAPETDHPEELSEEVTEESAPVEEAGVESPQPEESEISQPEEEPIPQEEPATEAPADEEEAPVEEPVSEEAPAERPAPEEVPVEVIPAPLALMEDGDEEDSLQDLGLTDPGDVGDLNLDELDEEPNLDELDEEPMLDPESCPEEPLPEEPKSEEISEEPSAEEEAPAEAEEQFSAPPAEDTPAAEQEPEITPEELEQIEAENLPEDGAEDEEEPEEEPETQEEPQEKYTLTTWWADNCYRCFAVFITAILLTMTLAIHCDLLVSVSVYKLGEDKPALSRVSTEHDLDQLLADAGFERQEGDGYRWSGYGEDHRATLTYCPVFTVKIHSKLDGDEQFTTNAVVEKTLRQMLEERGYEFGSLDYLEPGFSTVPIEDIDLTIYRVEVKDYEATKVLPYETVYKETSLFYRNQSRQLKTVEGKDGEARIAVHERYLDGEMVDYNEEIIETITEPVNEVIKVYGAKAPVSDMEGPPIVDGKPEGWKLVLTGRATGYSAGRTYRRVKGASGMWLSYGYVAVNPRQIPYGTKLYIVSQDGNFVYGYCIAADTGIALMAGIISVDLFYDTYTESAINAVWNVNIYAEP